MYDMMMTYAGDQERYAKISGHGFRILAEAMEADFEAMLNAIWDDDYEAHVLMFLYGADEREKMLS